MPFEPFQGPGTPEASAQPKLTIRASRDGYLNAAADRQRFQDIDEVVFLTDTDTNQLAIAPADAYPDQHAYSILRDNEHGGELFTKSVLREYGLDSDTRDAVVRLGLEWRDDLTAYVADLSPLLEDDPDTDADTDQVEDTETDEDDDQVACTHPECDEAFDTEQGMKIHRGRIHDSTRKQLEQNGTSTESESDDDADDGDALLTRQAESFVADKGIRKLSALAEALEVEPGIARKHARAADVYSNVRDDTVNRPGVSG